MDDKNPQNIQISAHLEKILDQLESETEKMQPIIESVCFSAKRKGRRVEVLHKQRATTQKIK